MSEVESGRRQPNPDGLPISGIIEFKLDVDGLNATATIKDVYSQSGEWLDYKPLERRGYITVWKSDWTEWGGTDYN